MKDKLNQDIKAFITISIFLLIVLKIAFFRESFVLVLRTFTAFYFFLVPGLLLTYLIFEKLEFLERFFLGSITGFAMLGILGYYTGLLLHIHVRYLTPYLAILVVLAESLLLYIKNRKSL